MSETLHRSLEEIVARAASGAVTAAALVETHLDALARIGPTLNAVARLEPEAARAAATRLDAQAVAERGPLHAAPLAHKDLYGRAGWRLEAGSKILAGESARSTAHAIAALDRAGAMDLGRLNTVEFAMGGHGRNVHTGPPRNPWNPAHVTGGSSSGSAAAVAAGAVPAALGSDTGGSIRLPAAACGLVGLKPTAGRIGRSGIFPLSGTLDTAGPLCRTVRDAALMLQALAGPDPRDPQVVDLPVPDCLSGIEDGLDGLRIGIPRPYFFDPLEGAVAAQTEAAIALLEREGARIADTAIGGVETANRLAVLIINAEASAQHRPWLETRARDYGPETLARLIAGLLLPAEAYLTALGRRRSLLAEVMSGPLAEHDLLAVPCWTTDVPEIAPDAAPGFAKQAMDIGHCNRPFNMLGLPAIVVPCGLSPTGLPVALQLVARPFAEATLLRAARAFERARAFWQDHRPVVMA
ncbi:MAG: amidase [Paracoccaceae bacterium]